MSTENKESITVNIWRGMLREGVPNLHILDMAQKHLTGLKALPDDVPGKDQAVKDVEAFISEINK